VLSGEQYGADAYKINTIDVGGQISLYTDSAVLATSPPFFKEKKDILDE
jgi:hypothetical protein